MRKPKLVVAFAVTLGLLALTAVQATELPPVDGILGFAYEIESGWLAVKIPVPAGYALSGAMWYNNDGGIVFPAVLAGTGIPGGPGTVAEMTNLTENISGASSGWSTLTLSEPVAASQGALYLVFSLPSGSSCETEGEGGGPGWGYCRAEVGMPGWMSVDGETWIKLSRTAGFAFVPTLVPIEEGMLVKSLSGNLAPVIDKPYLAAGPNPFNPRTEIRFGLPQSASVRLDIYDVRGRRVNRLLDGAFPAGPHSVTWTGVDTAGRSMASGVYFVRLRIGSEELTQKLMLLR